MILSKEDKETITSSPIKECNKQEYIKFEDIIAVYGVANAYFSELAEFSHGPICNVPNKDFMKIIKTNKLKIDAHKCKHFIQFCRHVSCKLSGYKTQDRTKLKGDYRMKVIKDDCNSAEQTESVETNKNIKTIITDSFNYNDNALYAHKYFNIYSFLKLFADSEGKCFYCNKHFDLKMPNKYLSCDVSDCDFFGGNYQQSISIVKDGKKNHNHNNKLQWSLERINNTIGHYQSNCVLACIECNLKRCTQNHKHFKFTKSTAFLKVGGK